MQINTTTRGRGLLASPLPGKQIHNVTTQASYFFFAGMGRLLGACQQGHQPLLCENTLTSCILNLAFSRSLQILTVRVLISCTLCGGASSSPLLRV